MQRQLQSPLARGAALARARCLDAESGTEIHLAIELSEIQTEVLRITQDFLWALPFALAVDRSGGVVDFAQGDAAPCWN